MNRKQFVGALVAIGASASHAQSPESAAQQAADPKRKFQQEWLKALLENLDSQFDEATRTKLMEACGRACARRGAAAALAKAAGGDLDKLVVAIGSLVGPENARREGSAVRLRYTKCYCPLVGDGPDRLSNTYCHCSRGWALEVFGTVTGKPVRVELLRSIKRGDPICEFLIRT